MTELAIVTAGFKFKLGHVSFIRTWDHWSLTRSPGST